MAVSTIRMNHTSLFLMVRWETTGLKATGFAKSGCSRRRYARSVKTNMQGYLMAAIKAPDRQQDEDMASSQPMAVQSTAR